MKLPLEIVGAAIRDAEGRVIISTLNPCNMEERLQIVAAVNATAHDFGCGRGCIIFDNNVDLCRRVSELKAEIGRLRKDASTNQTISNHPISK